MYIYLSSSSLATVEELFKIDPNNEIVIARGISCCIQLKDLEKSLNFCDKHLGQVMKTPVN